MSSDRWTRHGRSRSERPASKARPNRVRGSLAALLAALLLLPAPAFSQTDGGGPGGAPVLPGAPESPDQSPTEPAPSSIQELISDPGGVRAALAAQGVAYSLTYIGEGMANLSGGFRRGAIGQGRLDAQLDLDLAKMLGWTGATIHANAYGIHGHGLSRYYLANLHVTSAIEALSSGRLYELYLEQKLFDDKLSVRAGQLALDTEFIVSQFATLFVNSTFGFPTITAADLPNGGPAYPLATPGVRVKYAPSAALSFAGGVYNGNPSGTGPGDPQRDNRNGLEFRARDPALLIGEIAYTYGGAGPAGLPGTVKVGGWHHLGPFADQRFGTAPDGSRALLADPDTSAAPRRLRGNAGGYAVLDQTLYRLPGTSDGGIGAFVRVSGAPGDRNLIDLYADGGLTFKGFVPGRPNDTFGIAVAHARVSARVRGFDADTAVFNPAAFQPIRSSETAVELTYQAQVAPGITLQPDLQYIVRPGAGIVDPRGTGGGTLRDAVVVGMRASIRY